MKRLAFIAFIATLVLILPLTAWADVGVEIDGQEYLFDPPPFIQDGRTLVPMRAFFEALGATVDWEPETQTAIGTRGDIIVRIPIGSTSPTINEEVEEIQVPAQIINNRTYIPLRFVGEALGDDVVWDGAMRKITITGSGSAAIPEETIAPEETTIPQIRKDDFTLSIDTLPYRGAVLFIDYNGTEGLSDYTLTVNIGQSGATMQEKMSVEEINAQLVAEIIDLMYVTGSELDCVLNIINGDGELFAYEYSIPFEKYWPWKDWMFDLNERVIIEQQWHPFSYDYPAHRKQMGAHASWDFNTRRANDVNVYSGTIGVVFRIVPEHETVEVYNPHVGAIIDYGHVNPVAGLRVGQDINPGDLIAQVVPAWSHVHYSIIRPYSYHRNIQEIRMQFKPSERWSGYYWPAIVSKDGRYIKDAKDYKDPFYFHEPTTLGYWYKDTLPEGIHDKMLEIFKKENQGVVLPAIEPLSNIDTKQPEKSRIGIGGREPTEVAERHITAERWVGGSYAEQLDDSIIAESLVIVVHVPGYFGVSERIEEKFGFNYKAINEGINNNGEFVDVYESGNRTTIVFGAKDLEVLDRIIGKFDFSTYL